MRPLRQAQDDAPFDRLRMTLCGRLRVKHFGRLDDEVVLT
jgi:hypothetical protein